LWRCQPQCHGTTSPFKNRAEYAWEYAQNIADLLTPQTGAYYEIWLDGEKAVSAKKIHM